MRKSGLFILFVLFLVAFSFYPRASIYRASERIGGWLAEDVKLVYTWVQTHDSAYFVDRF